MVSKRNVPLPAYLLTHADARPVLLPAVYMYGAHPLHVVLHKTFLHPVTSKTEFHNLSAIPSTLISTTNMDQPINGYYNYRYLITITESYFLSVAMFYVMSSACVSRHV
jgi:hypothetical protein